MFAIFLTEGMDPFYRNIASFPTVVFTFGLAVSMLYWMIAVLGMIEIDVLDVPDTDGMDSDTGTAASLLTWLGLNGVPVTVAITLLSFFGWIICYFAVHFLMPFATGTLLRYGLGLVVLAGSLYASVVITSLAIRPLRTLFKKAQRHVEKHVLGQTAVVRTSRVTETFGEATLEDGGAGLILKVRASGATEMKTGDRVVLLEYDKSTNTYRVIPEDEFTTG